MPKPAKLFSLVDVDSWSSEGTWQNEYGFTITQLSPRQYRIYTPEGYMLNPFTYPTLESAISVVETMLGDYKMTNRLRRPVYKTTPQKYEMSQEPLSVPGWFATSMPDGTYSIGYSGPKGDYEDIQVDLWDRAAAEEWIRSNAAYLDEMLLEQERMVESDYTAQFGRPPTADEWGGQLPPSQRSLRTRRPLRSTQPVRKTAPRKVTADEVADDMLSTLGYVYTGDMGAGSPNATMHGSAAIYEINFPVNYGSISVYEDGTIGATWMERGENGEIVESFDEGANFTTVEQADRWLRDFEAEYAYQNQTRGGRRIARRPLRTLSGIPSRVAPPLGVIRNDANKARGVAALRALRAKYRKNVAGKYGEYGDESLVTQGADFGDESENFETYDDAVSTLEEAQRFIKQAIMVLESLSNSPLPGVVGGQLRQYTIPSLQSWIESEYQIGSLSDLISQLGEYS